MIGKGLLYTERGTDRGRSLCPLAGHRHCSHPANPLCPQRARGSGHPADVHRGINILSGTPVEKNPAEQWQDLGSVVPALLAVAVFATVDGVAYYALLKKWKVLSLTVATGFYALVATGAGMLTLAFWRPHGAL